MVISTEQIKVLLIGDKPKETRSIIKKLSDAKDARFDVKSVESILAGLEYLSQGEIDVVLLDIPLSDSEGLDNLAAVPEHALTVPIIVLTGPSDENLALEAIRHGAQDHLVKNQMNEKALSRSIRYAIERQRLGPAPRETEERYKAFLDSAPDPMVIVANDGTIHACSAATETLSGFRREELEGKSFTKLALLHPEDLPKLVEYFERLQQGQNVEGFELQIKHKDGRPRWVSVNMSTIKPTQGQADILVIAHDITKHKHAEQALREAEGRYHAIFDNPLNMVFIYDERGVILDANESAIKRFGYSREDLGKVRFQDVVHPEDLPTTLESVAHLLANETSGALRMRAFSKASGEVIWVEVYGYLIEQDRERFQVVAIARDITEHRQAHEALQRSEERFRTLIENCSDVITIVDPDGTMRYNSPSLERMLGYEPAELEGTNMFLLLHPEEQQTTTHRFSSFVSEPGASATTIQRLVHKDGSWRTFEVVSTNLVNAPNIQGIVANWHDITDRREAEENLKNREAYYRRLLEHGTDGIIVLDIMGTMLHYSPSLKRLLGYEESENIGRSIFDFVHPDDVAPAVEKFAGLAATPGATDMIELRGLHKDGSWRPIEVIGASHLHDPAVGGIVLNLRDLTEITEAEESLRQSEERFRTLIENSSDVITIIAADGTILYESPSVERVMGYRPDELVGKNAYEFLHPDDQLNITQELTDFLGRQEAIYDTVRRLRHKDGSWRTMEVVSTNLLESPIIQGIVTNFRDITDRKDAEESLARYAAELTRSNTELEQFAFVASHDLKEPLRMVRVYVQLLAKRYAGKLDTDADEFINYAVDGAGRMHDLIEGLLAYSRVGAPDTKFEPVNLEAALDQAIANLQMAVDENEAQISHDPLPTVMGDESQLRQLFQNLISDAIRFRAEEPPRIRISVEQKDQEWLFSVQDNGIGFEPEYGERIFVIFKRLHVKEKYPGTGIGLTLCRKIVECHGGQMWAESELGQGATFHFTIPVSGGT